MICLRAKAWKRGVRAFELYKLLKRFNNLYKMPDIIFKLHFANKVVRRYGEPVIEHYSHVSTLNEFLRMPEWRPHWS